MSQLKSMEGQSQKEERGQCFIVQRSQNNPNSFLSKISVSELPDSALFQYHNYTINDDIPECIPSNIIFKQNAHLSNTISSSKK